MIKAIETRYAGCRFRSRLEARWAVFFDHADIPWEYEPEGFEIDGRYYLPDFRLPECGTWIEVKPEMPDIDILEFLHVAAGQLPQNHTKGETGPALMILGPIPEVGHFDIGWRGLDGPSCGCLDLGMCIPGNSVGRHERCISGTHLTFSGSSGAACEACDGTGLSSSPWGFGVYAKNRRPWWLSVLIKFGQMHVVDQSETMYPEVRAAYRAARAARFEHGEHG